MAEDNSTVNRYSREEAANANTMAQAARSLTEELKDQLGVRSRLNETQRETLNLARQLQRSAQENTVEIGNSGNIESQIAKDVKTRLAIQRELNDLTKGANTASQSSLDNANQITKISQEINKLEQIRVGRTGAIVDRINDAIARREAELSATKLIRDTDAQRIALLNQMTSVNDEVIRQRQEEVQIQKGINDNMGVTGALVKGTGALMERLGMRSGIFQDAMKDSAKSMREMAEENVRNNAGFSKTEIMLTGFSKLSKGFGKALLDPFSILAKILVVLTSIDKVQAEYTRQTGRQASQLKGSLKIYQKQVSQVSTLVDLMKTAGELSRQTGLDISSIFSPEQIGQISDAQKLLGLSAEQARGLGMQMKLTNQSADQIGNTIYDNIDAGINKKAVYDDILSTSDDIVASAGGNTKALAKAASAAKKLGMDLSKVNQIADGLLDFESSIGSELEAQLLTGKQINLNKAREAALNNDLEGVANELRKNGASAAEFSKMNRIQQEGLSKALGMSRQELAKTLLTEKARAGMTEKQIADARGVTLEQSKQMDIQQKLQDSLFKLSEAFIPILDILHPIVDLLGKGLNLISPFTPALLGAYGVIRLMRLGIREKVKGMISFGKQIIAAAQNFDILNHKQKLVGKMYKGGQFLPGGGRAKAGGERVGGLFGKATPKTPPIDPKTAKGTTSFLDSFSKIPMKKVLQGAGAILILSGAMFIAAKALKEFEEVKFEQVMFGIGTIAALSVVARALGNAGPQILKGALAIAILSASLIPLGFALNLAAPGIEAFGKVISGAFKGLSTLITAVAGGFVRIMEAVTMKSIGPMLLLGGALMSIAAGLGAISVAGILALPTLLALTRLGMVATPLAKIMGNTGTESSSEESTLKSIEKKLISINDHLAKGTNVYLDSEKIFSSASQNMAAQGAG